MRLLHTDSFQLHSFYDEAIPPYAILSHTWGKPEEEVTLQDLNDPRIRSQSRFSKIRSCCKLAASESLSFVWIDTCCIDKTSSAELSEAINSMYVWYKNSQVCYVYLVDFESARQMRSTGGVDHARKRNLGGRWFERGWTLQELLAPSDVQFLDRWWTRIGSKWELEQQISNLTGVSLEHLRNPNDACVAVKLSWASDRKTTRLEDRAYCLLGLLDVNLPLMYGEGEKAFLRLQYEFVKNSSDESIFAWTDSGMQWGGIFARSPSAFADSGNIYEASFAHLERTPYTMTNRGLAMEISWGGHDPVYFSESHRCRQVLELQCARMGEERKPFQVQLVRRSKNQWARTGEPVDAATIIQSKSHLHGLKLIYIDPISVPSLHCSSGFTSKDLRPKAAVHINRDYLTKSNRESGALRMVGNHVRKCQIVVHAQEICIFSDEPEQWYSCLLFLQWHSRSTFPLFISVHEGGIYLGILPKQMNRDRFRFLWGSNKYGVFKPFTGLACCYSTDPATIWRDTYVSEADRLSYLLTRALRDGGTAYDVLITRPEDFEKSGCTSGSVWDPADFPPAQNQSHG